eukprot:TRINITY_DN8189_c0_g1_i1.p1 TRINITY_DN8189_c0_g1~~TRINITY_DN8189_c0_g1_i1.p1  ORF type:complete len:1475 (+),score=385.52 TRINITY_DN8189_c0_g1_i1:123-4547(+)
MAALDQERRVELQKQLDDIQKQYLPQAGGPRTATRLYGDMVNNTLDINQHDKPSRGERALNDLHSTKAELQNMESMQSRKRSELNFRKEGLDLSLRQLCGDSARMRSSLMELDLALHKPQRDAALQKVNSLAVPRDIAVQFEDQQKLLVEQRRTLDSLKTDLQVAQDEQQRIFQEHRNDYLEGHSREEAERLGVAGPIDPSTLRKAHELLREQTVEDFAAGYMPVPGADEVQPGLDGYLLVEVYSVKGLSVDQLERLISLKVVLTETGTGKQLTECLVAGPLHFDGLRPKSLPVTVPEEAAGMKLDVQVSLNGPDGGAQAQVPFGRISEERREPATLDLAGTGEWPPQGLSMEVAMSGTPARDGAGRGLALSRAVENPSHAARSLHQGRELAPSQMYFREQALAYERAGAPEPFNHGQALRERTPQKASRNFLTPASDGQAEDSFAGGRLPFAGFAEKPASVPVLRGPQAPPAAPAALAPASDGYPAKPPEAAAAAGGDGGGGGDAEADEDRGFDTRGLLARAGPHALSREVGARGGPLAPGGMGLSIDEHLQAPYHGGFGHGAQVGSRPAAAAPQAAGVGFAGGAQGLLQQAAQLQERQRAFAFPAAPGPPSAMPMPPGPGFSQGASAAPLPFRGPGAGPPLVQGNTVATAAAAAWSGAAVTGAGGGGGGGGAYSSEEQGVPLPPLRSYAKRPTQPTASPSPSAEEGRTFNGHGIPFAAFAGEGDGAAQRTPRLRTLAGSQHSPRGGTQKMRTVRSLQLRPPDTDKPLQELFRIVRGLHTDGRLDKADAQAVLNFAARLAQPGAIGAEAGGGDDTLAEYTGMMLDALEAYGESVVMTLWVLEALTAIWDFASSGYRLQLSVLLFEGFSKSAQRFMKDPDINIHARLLAGLASVATPDCYMEVENIVNYVLEQMEQSSTRLPPIMAEHALAVLCSVRSTHRVAEQVGHVLLVLRGFKSDAHLVTRALVTLAELFELLEKERLGTSLDKKSFLKSKGLPTDATDVRLVSNTLDLYPTHRKVAGAALRALAILSRTSNSRLREVLGDSQRGMAQAQRRHVSSRSVNLHVGEIVRAASRFKPELITDGLVLMVAHSLRAYWRDAGVAQVALEAFDALVEEGSHMQRVVDIVPVSQVILLGDIHHATPSVTKPLCRLMKVLATAPGHNHCEELGKAGAVAVCVRAIESNKDDTDNVVAAARALKTLVLGSPEAMRHVVRLGGIRAVFDALVAKHGDAPVVQASLAAVAAMGQDPDARLQLLSPAVADSATVLVIIMRVASQLAIADPDILAQACCAVGAITFVEEDKDKGTQVKWRKVVNQDKLREICDEIASVHVEFEKGAAYFTRLVNGAVMCDLSHERLLSLNGEDLVGHLQPRQRGRKEQGLRHEGSQGAAKRKGAGADKSKPAGATTKGKGLLVATQGFDVFAPLRGLGVGKPPLPEHEDSENDMEPQDTYEEQDKEEGLGIASILGIAGLFN